MNHDLEKKPLADTQFPFGLPAEIRARRQEEIEQQAIKDANESFEKIRHLLDDVIKTEFPAKGAKKKQRRAKQ